MLDIKLFRNPEDIERIKESEKKRFKNPGAVDNLVALDTDWRNSKKRIDDLKHNKNKITREITELMQEKQKEKAQPLISELQEIKNEISGLEKRCDELKLNSAQLRYTIGNILHDSVPVAEDESGNKIERVFGEKPGFDFKPRPHADLIIDLGCDVEKAAEIAGARTYYLKHDIALLNLALINFSINFMVEKGYIPVWTPFFMRKAPMEAAAELADFEEQLYKIEGEDLFLIATSEQPLAALHSNEILDEDNLPLKYAGISTCFRKEAGSHGRDTKGIFRIHQFEKVEQYVYCKPGDSWKMQDEMLGITEELFKKLGIHYRVANIASGEMNDNAARKYDLEGWFPAQNNYRELVSCSNCTDYQARKLNIKFGKAGGNKEVVHTLNSTVMATERTICYILENYQKEDGSVEIPEVLRPYMNEKKFMFHIK
ncbi:serine--tRNA ligase [Candidatus Altiarchaeales archaeon WOR_SM1_SCG]|nr:serine--tRNA ligase [Candidatus Altiarchaeales archaeon WOR_SM1_SCG]